MDILSLRNSIPLYQKNANYAYLDSSATTLKPAAVLNKMNEYYQEYGVNIHRGVYGLCYRATQEFDLAREKVAKYINADTNEIVFTRGTTNSLNLVALSWGLEHIQAGDEIITSELEHNSSLLPWMQVAKAKKANLVYVPLDAEGRITLGNFSKVITKKTKVVALTYISNVMGYITPISEIITLAKTHNCLTVIDAAQAAPHIPIDVKKIDCDFLAFSGHKMLGPTGVGVLYGKSNILKTMKPLEYGGDMNVSVTKTDVIAKEAPYKFEAGTPMIAEVIGLGKAVDVLLEVGLDKIMHHEKELHAYALEKLAKLSKIRIYNPTADIGIINFNIEEVHPHDAATFFDEAEVALRAGHHCAGLVTAWLGANNGTLRASFYAYNTKEDVDRFVDTVKEVVDFFC